jgi:Ca2+-binding RTX toxin-like protein
MVGANLTGVNAVDVVGLTIGTGSNDTLTGTSSKDNIFGLDGNDSINGGDGDDYLDGGSGADILTGGPGNDALFGAAGNDTLTGGGGRDTIHYRSGHGSDRVNGFTLGSSGDILSFSGIAAIDVVQSGANTQLRSGNGIAGDAGFGTGALLITLANTSFTAAHVSTNISSTNRPIFQFS